MDISSFSLLPYHGEPGYGTLMPTGKAFRNVCVICQPPAHAVAASTVVDYGCTPPPSPVGLQISLIGLRHVLEIFSNV